LALHGKTTLEEVLTVTHNEGEVVEEKEPEKAMA
jgi:hypothetical protein